VTPASLRTLGKRAEEIDQVILDLEVVMNKLKQANLLFDAEAWEQIRKLNDQVKAQGKHDPEVMVMFKPVLDLTRPDRSTRELWPTRGRRSSVGSRESAMVTFSHERSG